MQQDLDFVIERDGIRGPGRDLPQWLFWAALAAAVLLGGWLRWPGIRAGYPYLTYVDEGYLLHSARETLATGDWDPAINAYPELAIRSVVAAARVLSPLAGRLAIAPPVAEARAAMSYYDRIEPPELILLARSISWLFSLSTIALAGLLARRLGGAAAGVVAAWAAALVPALVMRGAIAMVDIPATFFALAALAVVPLADDRRLLLRAGAAGACSGLAAISKYPAGLTLVAVAAVLALLPEASAGRKLRAVGAAIAGAVLAAAVLMPSTWRQPGTILARLQSHNLGYNTKVTPSVWNQMFARQEFDLPQIGTAELGYLFVALAVAGFAVLIVRRPTRAWGIGAATLAGLLLALSVHYSFQLFRNVLPAVPLGGVAIGVLAAALGGRLGRPRIAVALALALLLALFLPAGLASARQRAGLVDSRQQAVAWLLAHRLRQQPLLVTDELALAAREIERLGAKTVVAPGPEFQTELRKTRPRFLLTGDLLQDGRPLIAPEDHAWILRRYRPVATFGSEASESSPWAWRGNQLRVWILQRTKQPSAAVPPEGRPVPEFPQKAL